MEPNPFALLKISTHATRQEVVTHSRELIQETEDQKLQLQYRKAVEQIISHPFERLVKAVWEMPYTDYAEHEEIWNRFKKAHQMNPVNLTSLAPLTADFEARAFHQDYLLDILLSVLRHQYSRPKQPLMMGKITSAEVSKKPSLADLF